MYSHLCVDWAYVLSCELCCELLDMNAGELDPCPLAVRATTFSLLEYLLSPRTKN